MGTVSQFFQPPLYWQQFEELAIGMLREVYDVPTAQAYGRAGQAQLGVDVYGMSRFGMIGVQCKRLTDLDHNGDPYPGGVISRPYLNRAAKDALEFRPTLSLWILATTARRDARVQNYVNELNATWERRRIHTRVLVWAWDDCVSILNSFPNLQQQYYHQVIQVRSPDDLDEIILETISQAFMRPAFELPLHCETSDEFRQALADTQRALRTGELLDRVTRHVIRKAVGGYVQITKLEVRAELEVLDRLLRQLRLGIEEGLRDRSIVLHHVRTARYLAFKDLALAKALTDLREQCLHALNRSRRAALLPPI